MVELVHDRETVTVGGKLPIASSSWIFALRIAHHVCFHSLFDSSSSSEDWDKSEDACWRHNEPKMLGIFLRSLDWPLPVEQDGYVQETVDGKQTRVLRKWIRAVEVWLISVGRFRLETLDRIQLAKRKEWGWT